MFKRYTHVERLSKEECEGLLDNEKVYVTAKVDGTNASIWLDDGEVKCGSRSRQIFEGKDKDNAGFAHWVCNSDCDEILKIKNLLNHMPQLTLYGEWLGSSKFVGHIKSYNQDALNRFWIFDVYDNDACEYMPEEDWRKLVEEYGLAEYAVKILAVLNNPSVEDVEKVAKENYFLLDNSNHPGEGVVCKVPGWKNKFGDMAYGKLVLSEFVESKRKNKEPVNFDNIEESIAEIYLTEAEMSKNMGKVCIALGEDEFDKKSGKMIGYYLNLCFTDSVLGEMPDICKKYRNPTIDFSKLKGICALKAKQYIGL